jgi:hypothetical protein
MEKEIKQSLMLYGGSYNWVMNDIYNLTQEAKSMLEKGEAKSNDQAAFLVIDKRF